MLQVLTVACLSLAAVVAVSVVEDKRRDWILDSGTYDGYESAPYAVDPSSKGKPYEKRYYPAQKWVTTEFTSVSMDFGQFFSFMKLFKYISGKNAEEQPVNMTVPVLMNINLPNPFSFKLRNYGMSFYIPRSFQKRPPGPEDPEVDIMVIGPMTVYVKAYTGYSNEIECMKEFALLRTMLRNDNVTFDDSTLFYAGYDSPLHYKNRRNEVWLKEIAK